MSSLLFGVEIEVSSGHQKYQDLKNVSVPYWHNKSDISIRPHGREFISPTFEWENRGQIFDTIKRLQNLGVRCNQSCGLHVHMSGLFPKWNRQLEEHLENWYEKIKPGFKSAASRRRGYCTEFDGNNRRYHFVCRVGRNGDRLHIEIRLFNAHLCQRWVARCLWEAKKLGESLENMARIAA
jgi:hypothetical protein